MLTLLFACKQPTEPPDDGKTSDTSIPTSPTGSVEILSLSVAYPEVDSVRLAQRLIATTDRPTRATVTLTPDDGSRARQIAFPDLATEHDLPLLALVADASYTATASFVAEDGGQAEGEIPFESGPAPAGIPEIELVSSEPDQIEPGYRIVPTEVGDSVHLLAIDGEGRVVWGWDSGGYTVRAVSFSEGVVGSLVGNGVLKVTPLGETVSLWLPEGVDVEGAIPLQVDGLHHEVTFAEDGSFYSFSKRTITVEDYPSSEDDPNATAPADIDDDLVVHIAQDGSLLSEWSLADRLDPTRIGYGSLQRNGSGANAPYDWAHANAIVPREDGSVIVSLRHQDAVISLSGADGSLQWILGNSDGWPPALEALRLQPVGALSWPYHQHAPMVGPDGQIVMFDNGNDARTTPYSQSPDPGGLYSRVVEYQIDEQAHTVEQTFESLGPQGGLYSQALGNADILPVTGHIFATFPYLHEEGGVDNSSIGDGERSSRLIEIDRQSGQIVWDLRLSTKESDEPNGLLSDRAIFVPSLYPSSVVETWLP